MIAPQRNQVNLHTSTNYPSYSSNPPEMNASSFEASILKCSNTVTLYHFRTLLNNVCLP